MIESSEPQLAPPGAGLPGVELAVGRMLFRWRCWSGGRDEFVAAFEREREMIRELVAGIDPGRRGERVLIARLRGLEDSSRYWSMWMTLDHLRITNGVFAQVIAGLAKGRVPSRPASTAAVKPTDQVTEQVEAAYEASCDRFLETVAAIPDLRTTARYAHPWFGPLDGFGWLALASMHLGIHRAQMEAIRRRLPTWA